MSEKDKRNFRNSLDKIVIGGTINTVGSGINVLSSGRVYRIVCNAQVSSKVEVASRLRDFMKDIKERRWLREVKSNDFGCCKSFLCRIGSRDLQGKAFRRAFRRRK